MRKLKRTTRTPALLPEQFSDSLGNGYKAEAQGEVALMRAVLEDALNCFQRQFFTSEQHAQKLAQDAEEWFFTDDEGWPFSFVYICAVLGLHPEYVRLGLKRWRQHHPVEQWRKKRHVVRVRRRGES